MKNIYVTKPFLPPLEEFQVYLKQIWQSAHLTNNGAFHQQLESELAAFLGVKYVSLFANGTLALLAALKALRITGEVITTPFSFVATSHAIKWNNSTPVFVDIDPVHGNIDPSLIEAAITPETTAIMPVHVYGNPCQSGQIQKIAEKHHLKVIYDACHAFGVNMNGNTILDYGDLSVLSFHATKTFNTFEGGAIISHTEEMKKEINHLKNFGFIDEITVVRTGMNAKMNEFQAAVGLLQLKYFERQVSGRKKAAIQYDKSLSGIKGITVLEPAKDYTHNYSYYPVLVKEEYGLSRDDLYELLKTKGIHTRRYFYPLISEFPMYETLPSAGEKNLPVATKLSRQVLCLPIYYDLEEDIIQKICNTIISKQA